MRNLYFRGKNDSFFVTDNNWESYYLIEQSKLNFDLYKKENDQDKQVITRTSHKFNDRGLTELFFYELDTIRGLLEVKYPSAIFKECGYGDEYEVFATAAIFDLPYQYVINNIHCYGSNDGKIDSFFVDDIEEVIYICQVKLGSNVDSSIPDKMKDTFDTFIRNSRSKANKDFTSKIKENYARETLSNYVSKTIVMSEVEIFDADFNYNLSSVINKFISKNLLPRNKINIKLKIKKDNKKDLLHESFDKNQAFFFCKANLLIESILDSLGDDYHEVFFQNVRGILKPNKLVADTIMKDPSNFAMYNNGISITCSKFSENGININIKNPSIVNGQQTVMALINNYSIDPQITENVFIPVFLKKVENTALLTNVARYNNSQKALKPIDLVSLSTNVREIQNYLLTESDTQYYLDIYSSGRITRRDNILKFVSINHIKIKDFLRLYFSIVDYKMLGIWKNSFSVGLDNSNYETVDFDKCISEKVCKTICEFNNHMKQTNDQNLKNDIRSYDLPFMHIMYNNENDIQEAERIVRLIIAKYPEKNIPDIFRSKDIHKDIYLNDNL